MRFERVEFIELCVRDAARVAALYSGAFGFETIAATGGDSVRSVLLAQEGVRLVLTQPLTGTGPVAEHVRRHGDAVRDIGFLVEDVESAFRDLVARGARPVHEPHPCGRGGGVRAAVAGVGDVVHSLVERGSAAGRPYWFNPELSQADDRPASTPRPPAPAAFKEIDHVAFCLAPGSLRSAVDFYERAFGFWTSHREYIDSGMSGMNSEVVQNDNGRIRFPLQEPLPDNPSGQIAEYLRLHGGPGVQHIALMTEDMVGSLTWLRRQGVSFLKTPASYYDALPGRVGDIDEDLRALRDHGVLVDRDRWGYLLQIFTRSLHERGTLFFEVIQRKQARGFGSANIRALFEAMEREYGRPCP